jgi:hypothetical protein
MNSPLEKHEVRLRGLHPRLRCVPPAPGRPPGWLKPRTWTRQRPRVGASRFWSGGFIRSGEGRRAARGPLPRPLPAQTAARRGETFIGDPPPHVQVKSPRLFGETFRRCCGIFICSACGCGNRGSHARDPPRINPPPVRFGGGWAGGAGPGGGQRRTPPAPAKPSPAPGRRTHAPSTHALPSHFPRTSAAPPLPGRPLALTNPERGSILGPCRSIRCFTMSG